MIWRKKGFNSKIIFLLSSLAAALEVLLLRLCGDSWTVLSGNLLLVCLLMFIFGGWSAFFASKTLPAYYDENRISNYADGVFHMNFVGLCFNNRNWPHILKAMQLCTAVILAAFPLVYFAVSRLLPKVWLAARFPVMMIASFTVFIPIYVVGKRYE